jgi:hypothetical protein
VRTSFSVIVVDWHVLRITLLSRTLFVYQGIILLLLIETGMQFFVKDGLDVTV